MIQKFTLCFGLSIALIAPAMAKTKEEIVSHWQQQFESLKSFSFTADMQTVGADDEKSDEKPKTKDYKIDFVQDGAKYRTELNIVEGLEGLSSMASAYDGQYYETALKGNSLNAVIKSVTRQKELDKFGLINPLVMQYGFALGGDDAPSIEVLQRADTWSRLLNHIIDVQPTTRGNSPATILLIDAPDNQQYKVIVDDKTGFPMNWSKVDAKNNSQVNEETDVFVLLNSGQQEGAYSFPLGVRVTNPQEAKTSKVTVFTRNTTLKINQPVAQEFSFPVGPSTFLINGEVTLPKDDAEK